MSGPEPTPRASIVALVDGVEVPVGQVDAAARCDLALVEELLRLRLAAQRHGWSIELRDVDDRLVELFELTGLADLMVVPATEPDQSGEGPSSRGGRPNSGNSSG